MAFGQTPLDGSSVQIPMSSVVPDGTNTPVAVEGGPSLVTGGNTLAPASVYVKDGNDVAQGTSTDAANANSVVGQLKQIKTNTASVTLASLPTGANTIGAVTQASGPWTDNITQVGGSAVTLGSKTSANSFPVVVASDQGAMSMSQSGTWTVQPGNTANTTPWLATVNQGGNSATVTASNALKVDASATTQPVSGTVTMNAGTGTMNVSQLAASSVSGTLQTAQSGNAAGTPLSLLGMGVAMLTVNMTGFTGTVNFEGQEDGTNFGALNAVQVGTNTITSTAVGSTSTSIARYEIPVAGLQQIQARTSGVSAGTVTVTAHAVPVPYNGKVINANQVGTWNVGLQTTSGTALVADQTNSELRTSNYVTKTTAGDTPLTLGQATMVNSLPVTVASNQGAIGSVVAQAVAGTALAADQTNSELRVSNYVTKTTAGDTALTLGQATMVNSLPVAIASNQANIPIQIVDSGGTNKASVDSSGNQAVKGGFTEVAGQGTGVVNGANTDLFPSMDVSAYKWLSLQIAGTWAGSLAFQASNDNVNFQSFSLEASNGTASQSGLSVATTVNGIWAGPIQFRYLRVRMTAFTSNASLVGTLELYTVPASMFLVQASQAGGWVINAQAVATGGTSDAHLISAASTNATSIKGSAGQVYGYEIYNSNAAVRYVKLTNAASAPTPGTTPVFRTISVPPTSRVSFHSSTGLAMGTGIGFYTCTGLVDSDATAVGASDLSIDIDWK